MPPADHAQRVIIRSHATNILHLLASAHVPSSGNARASDEAGAAATEDHATNQRSGDRPRQDQLQHEPERQNRARSENVVLQALTSHPMMQRLEAMVEMYDQGGKTARANQGDQYAGHTQGKRPDALFRGVL